MVLALGRGGGGGAAVDDGGQAFLHDDGALEAAGARHLETKLLPLLVLVLLLLGLIAWSSEHTFQGNDSSLALPPTHSTLVSLYGPVNTGFREIIPD